MLAGAQPGARGCLTASWKGLTSGGGYTSRLQLFVDALVHKFGAFIEIFVRAAFFGPHPAFSCCARVRHWRGIRHGRPLCARRVRPGRRDRSGRIFRCGACGVGLATGEYQCAGRKQHSARSKKIAELYDHRLHLTLLETGFQLMVAQGAAGICLKYSIYATASNRFHIRVRNREPRRGRHVVPRNEHGTGGGDAYFLDYGGSRHAFLR